VLKFRIPSAILMLGALTASLYCLPSLAALGLLLAVSSLAIWEFYRMLDQAQIPVFRFYGMFCGAALITATFFTIGPTDQARATAYQWESAVLFFMVVAVFIRQFPQKHNDQPLATIACTHFGVLYVPLLFNYMTRILFAWDDVTLSDPIGPTGRLMFIYTIVLGKTPDIGAYFAGNRFGRHALFPRISPAKTWEGLGGGVLTAVACSLLFRKIVGSEIGALHLSYLDAAVLGLVLPLISAIGDLFESLLKRAAGVKDSGVLIPGMGGVLDVLDSLLFVAPALYVYAVFFM